MTLREIVYGFVAGFVIGVVCGVLIVYSKIAERTLYPLVIASQVIPVFAIAPLLIIWFGFGIQPKVIICALIVFFPICVNMVEGLRSAEKGIVELMRSYGASEARIFRSVRLPAAVPFLLIGTQVGHHVRRDRRRDRGVGRRRRRSRLPHGRCQLAVGDSLVFAAIITLAVVGVALFGLVRVVGDVAFPWQAKVESE